jgi:hypothetical protein
MAGIPAGRDACSVAGNAGYYERHRPQQTLLYQIIEQHYPVFSALMAEQSRKLPAVLPEYQIGLNSLTFLRLS